MCTFTGLSVGDGLAFIAVVPLRAIVAVPAGCEMAALDAHAPTLEAGQLVQLHVEPALPGVHVAVTS